MQKTIEAKKEKNGLVLKNSDIEMLVNSPGLEALKQDKDLPISFSFKLANLLGKLQPTIVAYSAQKQKLIDKYGDRDKTGKLIQENGLFRFTVKVKWFQKDFNELLNLEFTLDSEKIPISMKDIPKGVISTNDILSLKPFIIFLEA